MTEQIQNQLIKNLWPFIILVLGPDQSRKHPKLSEEQVLEKLRDSLINSKEEIEVEGLEQTLKTTSKPNGAIELVKKIDKTIKHSNNNILMLAYQQGRVFQKFEMNKAFCNAATEFGLSKTTMNFKIDVVNFINQHPGMRNSSISLFCLQNDIRIWIICFWLIFFIILLFLLLCSFYKKGS